VKNANLLDNSVFSKGQIMRNIVGQTPRGDDFFPRDKIVNKIYRRLDSGSHVYLAAPRRVGKTAIMRHLEDRPREGYEFKYIITESIDNPLNYFKRLSKELHHLKSLTKKSIEKIRDFIPKIDKISLVLTGVDVKFAEETHKVFEEFKGLIKELETQSKTVTIMVDEFPQTVENISRQHGQVAAEQFLHFNREIRHEANENIRFIFTGSIGLPTLAEKLDATNTINDLETIDITPLKRGEAKEFLLKLLDYEKVSYEESAISYLLDKVQWFVPFYIQLIAKNIIDVCEETEENLNEIVVDKAFSELCHTRNDMYFEHYYSRLKKTFDEMELSFALNVLDEITQKEILSLNEIKMLAEQRDIIHYPRILRTLEFDGYIFKKADNTFQFTSPVLQLWWKNYVKI